MYDRFEQLAFDAQVCAAILGNLDTRDFALVALPGACPASLYGRGFVFIGVTGIVDGEPKTVLEVELDSAAIAALAMALIRHLAAIIVGKLHPEQPAPTDDSVAWCEGLHSLHDTRD